MQSAAYLMKSRNGVYFARFVIPNDKRNPTDSREFKLSTLTKDPRHAKALARRLRVLFESYLLQNVRPERQALIDYLRRNMTTQKPFPPIPFNAHKDESGEWRFTDIKPEDVPAISDFLEAMNRQESRPLSQVALNTSHDEKINEPGRLALAAKKTVAKFIKEYLDYESDRATEKEIGVKKVPQIRTRLKPFLENFAKRQVGTLTPADLEEFKKMLAYYPKNIHKLRYAINLTFDEIIRRSKAKLLLDNNEKPAQVITQNTLDGYIVTATNFLEFCKRQYAINPTLLDGFKAKTPKARKGVTRRAFNREELQRIFDSDYYRSANYNRSYQYWVIHLAAFTGARVNELAQLSPSDIEKDKDGLWFIKITAALDEGEDSKSLKNEESRRLIPVHQKLIDLGFISYVEKKKKEGVSNLFGINPAKADKYGKAPSQWFNNKYLRDFLKIYDPAVVFHSFRHRFITSLSQAIIDNSGLAEETILKERIPEALVLRRIAGHSVAHALTAGRSQYDIHTDTYTGEFSIASMKRVIDRLDYPGVVFHKYQELDVGKKKRMKKTAEKQDIDLIMVSPGDWTEIMS